MTRLLAVAALAAGMLSFAAPAQACTIDTCWFTQPVCSQVHCPSSVCEFLGTCGEPIPPRLPYCSERFDICLG